MYSSPMSTRRAAAEPLLFLHPLTGFLEEPCAGRRRFDDLAGVDAADLIDRHAVGCGALRIDLAALGIDLIDHGSEARGLRRVANHGIAVIALADRAGAARRIERAVLGARLAADRREQQGKQQRQDDPARQPRKSIPRKSTWF